MQPVELNPSVTVVQTVGIPVSQEFKLKDLRLVLN